MFTYQPRRKSFCGILKEQKMLSSLNLRLTQDPFLTWLGVLLIVTYFALVLLMSLFTSGTQGRCKFDLSHSKRDLTKKSGFKTRSPPTRIKWNRMVPHLLATTHEGSVSIWDIRNTREPSCRITAHMSKITGIDWSHKDKHSLLTCASGSSVIKVPTASTTELTHLVLVFRRPYEMPTDPGNRNTRR